MKQVRQQMNLVLRVALSALLLGSLSSCVFDSGVEWRGGPYALLWIDLPERVTLDRVVQDGDSFIGRVDATVFAVGWDGRYVVAKQHPYGDRSRTDYFIIDSRKDGEYADAADVVVGPLNSDQYAKKEAELNLPKFSKTLASLQ